MATPASVTTATPRPGRILQIHIKGPMSPPIYQPIYNQHGMSVTPMKPGDNSITMLARRSLTPAKAQPVMKARHFEHGSCISHLETRNARSPSTKPRLPATGITKFVSAANTRGNLRNCDMLHRLLRHDREQSARNRLQVSPTLSACYKLAPTQKERAVHITTSRTAQLF